MRRELTWRMAEFMQALKDSGLEKHIKSIANVARTWIDCVCPQLMALGDLGLGIYRGRADHRLPFRSHLMHKVMSNGRAGYAGLISLL